MEKLSWSVSRVWTLPGRGRVSSKPQGMSSKERRVEGTRKGTQQRDLPRGSSEGDKSARRQQAGCSVETHRPAAPTAKSLEVEGGTRCAGP